MADQTPSSSASASPPAPNIQDADAGSTSEKSDTEKAQFVMENRGKLIQDASTVMAIVDSLGTMVHREICQSIEDEKSSIKQMRMLYAKVIDPGPTVVKAAFYDALEHHQLPLLKSAETLSSQLKMKQKKKCKKFFGWKQDEEDPGNPTPLKDNFTNVYVTTGGSGAVNIQHEVMQIEAVSRKSATQEISIKYEDIFEPLPPENEQIRTVMTKGIAGIGKSVLVQKYALDWAEDKANQSTHFMFPFTFRELNSVKKSYSLEQFIHAFFVEAKGVPICNFDNPNTLFIFDGLDESRPPLDLANHEIITDVTKPTTVALLVTNLIKGNLLPSARIWITTRPAAANKMSQHFDRVTEVRGFTDDQKEEFFNNRFRDDKEQATKIISHIQTSRSLYIMCHIPVFCWLIAVVLEGIDENLALPKTLAAMFIHFILAHSKHMEARNSGDLNAGQAILSLGKLAFEQLDKGNLIFNQKDLTGCGIDIERAAVYTGVFTQFFKEEHGLKDKVFCFVHLSVQEFLAALYVFHSFINTGVNLLPHPFKWSKIITKKQTRFYQSAVDNALQSPNGHLDLFLRFLLGLSLETNQELLGRLLPMKKRNMSQTNQETIEYIKMKIGKNPSEERTINLFHCLNELNDHSLVEEIQKYLNSGSLSTDQLSPSQWSALVFILLSSGKELDVFDLKKYSASEEALLRLLPVVKASNRALLSGCNLTDRCCGELSSVLISSSSNLTELDLSDNDLHDSGIIQLCIALGSPHCKLKTLKLSGCNLTDRCCGELSSVLISSSSNLTELDLSDNDLHDSGIIQLCIAMGSPHCKLKTLKLSGCMISEEGCASLVSALRFNSHLKVLDLSYNHPGDIGIKNLSSLPLQTLSVDHCGENRLTPGVNKYSCQLSLDENTMHNDLILSEDRKVTWGGDQRRPEHPHRFTSYPQVLSTESLPERSYFEVKWGGRWVAVAVSYIDIARKEEGLSRFGDNDKSWMLRWYGRTGYSFSHNSIETKLSGPDPHKDGDVGEGVIGVFTDHRAGTVSFYCVDGNKKTLLHTVNTTFTQPLYAGIYVCDKAEVCAIW